MTVHRLMIDFPSEGTLRDFWRSLSSLTGAPTRLVPVEDAGSVRAYAVRQEARPKTAEQICLDLGLDVSERDELQIRR